MLSNVLYIAGIVLLLVALFAFLGLLHVAWATPLVIGVICLVVAYLLTRRTTGVL